MAPPKVMQNTGKYSYKKQIQEQQYYRVLENNSGTLHKNTIPINPILKFHSYFD